MLRFQYDSFQGDVLIIANVGDSRAVLAATSSDGNLEPVQLTIDCKPNLPRKLPHSFLYLK